MKLRVGVLSHPSVGGSARVAVELAAQLARRGHDVHLFSRSKPFGMGTGPRGATFCALDGGTAELAPGHLDAGWSASEIGRAAASLASSIQERSIQVLHFHHAAPFALIAKEVRRRLGASHPALIGTLHGTDVTARRDPADLLALRRALLQLDALTAVSASHASLTARAAVDAVVGLLRNPARQQILAKAALAQAERFSADVIVPRYEALYRLVLAQQGHQRVSKRIDPYMPCVR